MADKKPLSYAVRRKVQEVMADNPGMSMKEAIQQVVAQSKNAPPNAKAPKMDPMDAATSEYTPPKPPPTQSVPPSPPSRPAPPDMSFGKTAVQTPNYKPDYAQQTSTYTPPVKPSEMPNMSVPEAPPVSRMSSIMDGAKNMGRNLKAPAMLEGLNAVGSFISGGIQPKAPFEAPITNEATGETDRGNLYDFNAAKGATAALDNLVPPSKAGAHPSEMYPGGPEKYYKDMQNQKSVQPKPKPLETVEPLGVSSVDMSQFGDKPVDMDLSNRFDKKPARRPQPSAPSPATGIVTQNPYGEAPVDMDLSNRFDEKPKVDPFNKEGYLEHLAKGQDMYNKAKADNAPEEAAAPSPQQPSPEQPQGASYDDRIRNQNTLQGLDAWVRQGKKGMTGLDIAANPILENGAANVKAERDRAIQNEGLDPNSERSRIVREYLKKKYGTDVNEGMSADTMKEFNIPGQEQTSHINDINAKAKAAADAIAQKQWEAEQGFKQGQQADLNSFRAQQIQNAKDRLAFDKNKQRSAGAGTGAKEAKAQQALQQQAAAMREVYKQAGLPDEQINALIQAHLSGVSSGTFNQAQGQFLRQPEAQRKEQAASTRAAANEISLVNGIDSALSAMDARPQNFDLPDRALFKGLPGWAGNLVDSQSMGDQGAAESIKNRLLSELSGANITPSEEPRLYSGLNNFWTASPEEQRRTLMRAKEALNAKISAKGADVPASSKIIVRNPQTGDRMEVDEFEWANKIAKVDGENTDISGYEKEEE